MQKFWIVALFSLGFRSTVALAEEAPSGWGVFGSFAEGNFGYGAAPGFAMGAEKFFGCGEEFEFVGRMALVVASSVIVAPKANIDAKAFVIKGRNKVGFGPSLGASYVMKVADSPSDSRSWAPSVGAVLGYERVLEGGGSWGLGLEYSHLFEGRWAILNSAIYRF